MEPAPGGARPLPPAEGGPFDGDGEKNGEIRLIAGPMDSFWGYALGTLFIRFFGIFIVLGVLQAGMVLSGRVFTALARGSAPPEATSPTKDGCEPQANGIEPETAAAIGVALHLQAERPPPLPLAAPGSSAWAGGGLAQVTVDDVPYEVATGDVLMVIG